MAALLFRRRLEHEGYAVDIAVDGEMGLAMCVEVDYDLIALDYNMPKLDGISVLRELNQREEMPPVVIITAQNDTATAVEAMRLGAYDYLVKGTNAAYLLLLPGVIERALEKRRLELEQQRTIEALHIQNRNLALLNRVAQSLTSTLDVDEIALSLVKSISEFTDTQGSSVWLWDPTHLDFLRCVAIYPQRESAELAEMALSPGEGIAGWVAQHGESVLLDDANADPRHSRSGRPQAAVSDPLDDGRASAGATKSLASSNWSTTGTAATRRTTRYLPRRWHPRQPLPSKTRASLAICASVPKSCKCATRNSTLLPIPLPMI